MKDMALKYTAFAHALDKLGLASLSLLQQSGDSGANVERLDVETKQKITDVQNKWTANNPAVVNMLLSKVQKVAI